MCIQLILVLFSNGLDSDEGVEKFRQEKIFLWHPSIFSIKSQKKILGPPPRVKKLKNLKKFGKFAPEHPEKKQTIILQAQNAVVLFLIFSNFREFFVHNFTNHFVYSLVLARWVYFYKESVWIALPTEFSLICSQEI